MSNYPVRGGLSSSRMKLLGTYSPSRVVDLGNAKLVFLSGLTSGGDAPGDTKAQAQIVFDRMAELLRAEGGRLEHLVKITAFLVDIRDYGLYNEVRNKIFAGASPPPASATVGGAELVRPEARIEIEGVALIPKAS
jgi:enamine deaminase RidA (YjgF/YER057c/UK114 family)